MRRALLPVLLLLPLAGCLSDGGEEPDATRHSGDPDRLAASLLPPDGATLIEETTAYVAAWSNVDLPFQTTFTLPDGATMVRFVADPGTATVNVAMRHDDTGRRRCNQQTVTGFVDTLVGPRSCSSIAAIDPPGTQWVASATGTGSIDARIEFHHAPIDGPAGEVDWSQLSKATRELQPTSGSYIESFDGTRLWVEVTLPQGPGPWPTVIAASPYNGQAGRIPDSPESGPAGTPAMWTYWTQDYAKRGYAAVNIDVRGFGKSEGCVEVWGINEQKDQAMIVDWVAAQDWSDGNVGFYGQSYVATTPVAAAVQNPEALKAIIAVAPVIDAYHDWHYGGVPNGESSLSPVAYQVLVDTAGATWVAEDPTHPTDLARLLQYSTQGICDPTLVPLANDPTAIHGPYYDERDFGARAGDVTAAVLFTQGFEDANVKSAMINDWFNDIEAPKLGVFGHWLHQHPARMDAEALFLGWMDQYVKGIPLGLDTAYPAAIVSADEAHHRAADAWPPLGAAREWQFDFVNAVLAEEGDAQFRIPLVSSAAANGVAPAPTVDTATLRLAIDEPLPLVAPTLRLSGQVDAENGFVYASLHEEHAGGERLLTWGLVNLALSDDYDTYTPITPGSTIEVTLPFRPTETIVQPGSTLRLDIRGAAPGDAVGVAQPQPGIFTIDGATSALVLPAIAYDAYDPIPLTALP